MKIENEKTVDNGVEFVVVGIMVDEKTNIYSAHYNSKILLGEINSPLNFVKLFQQAKKNQLVFD